jgi:hypothetical protein
MLTCQEVTRLVSESLEKKLPWRARIRVVAHLTICRLCSRFRRQVLFLRDAAHRGLSADEAQESPAEPGLSTAARDRIKRMLKRGPM